MFRSLLLRFLVSSGVETPMYCYIIYNLAERHWSLKADGLSDFQPFPRQKKCYLTLVIWRRVVEGLRGSNFNLVHILQNCLIVCGYEAMFIVFICLVRSFLSTDTHANCRALLCKIPLFRNRKLR
jgi:hypothetical protein